MAEKRDVEPGCTGAWVDAKGGPILMHWINTLPCPVHTTHTTAPRDWPAFWRSLPPREAWEAAKAMPKIAGPWEKVADQEVRYDGRRRGTWVAWTVDDGIHVQPLRETFPDRASADAALRAADWVLVDGADPPEGT